MNKLILLLLLLVSCASHHTRGYVLSKNSATEGTMSVESNTVKVGDKLNLYGDQCYFGVRGYVNCSKVLKGQAEVKSISEDNRAEFQMRSPASFSKGDYLEDH